MNCVESVDMNKNETKVDRIGRKLYSVKERERLMRACEGSGKTKKQFALEQGLNYPTLIYWFTHLKGKKKKADSFSKRIRLKPIDTKPLFSTGQTTSAAIVEIVCGSTTVRLYRDR